jgi:hypothetical protein
VKLPAVVSNVASAAILSASALLLDPASGRAQNLNTNIDEICQGFAILNKELGAPAAPGTPASAKMQEQMKISSAQYGALWSLMKLTPTSNCTSLY